MAAPEVEPAILVLDEARGGQEDVLHAPALNSGGNLLDGGLVDVDMAGGVNLDEADALLHLHDSGRGLQGQVHFIGQVGANVQVLVGHVQARCPHLQMVGVVGEVAQLVAALGIRPHGVAVARDFVLQEHSSPRHSLALVIHHPATDRSTG